MTAAIDLGDGLAEIATALDIPVLIAAIFVLLLCALELGRFAVENWRRRVRARDLDLRQLTRQAIATPQQAAAIAYSAPSTLAGEALVEIATSPEPNRERSAMPSACCRRTS